MNDLPVQEGGRTRLALLLVAVSAITALYWILWFSDRSLIASETTKTYYQFENAFPLADGWWVLSMLGAAWALVTRRSSVLGWLLVSGGAGLYLFCMDFLYDAEHGIWTKGAGGRIEAVINVATLAINAGVLRWAWRRRSPLLDGGASVKQPALVSQVEASA
jgi:hypothetical protein